MKVQANNKTFIERLTSFLSAFWKLISYRKYKNHQYIDYWKLSNKVDYLNWEDVKDTMSYYDYKQENIRRHEELYRQELSKLKLKVDEDKWGLKKGLKESYINLLSPSGSEIKATKIHIIVSSIIVCLIMFLVEVFLRPGYLIKSMIKIIAFSMGIMSCKKLLGDYQKIFVSLDKKKLKPVIIIGFSVFVIILIGYFIFKDFIDLDMIRGKLLEKEGVSKENFIYVAFYISLVNSFIEELFFRGYVFGKLRENASRLFAYIYSSGLFALYHVAIMGTWFSPWIFVLAMIGLFVGGLIFNYLTEKFASMQASWFVHLMANLAINIVGFIMLGIIR